MYESNAGQVFKHMSDVVKNTVNNLSSKVKSEDEDSNVSIVVIPNKQKKNLKKFNLEVTDNNQNKYGINRSLEDLTWLRNNLRIDFPFCYVNIYV